MSTNSPETSERGSTALQKKEERLREGQQAMAEYLADNTPCAKGPRSCGPSDWRATRPTITRPSRRWQRSALPEQLAFLAIYHFQRRGLVLSVRPDAITAGSGATMQGGTGGLRFLF